MGTIVDVRPSLRERTAADKSLTQPVVRPTDRPSATAAKQYEWWRRVERRYEPNKSIDDPLWLYNLHWDTGRLLSAAIDLACRRRGGRRAIVELGFMIGRRYMPGVHGVLGALPIQLRARVEAQCIKFRQRFLNQLDALHQHKVIEARAVLHLVQDFVAHWERLTDFVARAAGVVVRMPSEIASVKGELNKALLGDSEPE